MEEPYGPMPFTIPPFFLPPSPTAHKPWLETLFAGRPRARFVGRRRLKSRHIVSKAPRRARRGNPDVSLVGKRKTMEAPVTFEAVHIRKRRRLLDEAEEEEEEDSIEEPELGSKTVMLDGIAVRRSCRIASIPSVDYSGACDDHDCDDDEDYVQP